MGFANKLKHARGGGHILSDWALVLIGERPMKLAQNLSLIVPRSKGGKRGKRQRETLYPEFCEVLGTDDNNKIKKRSKKKLGEILGSD